MLQLLYGATLRHDCRRYYPSVHDLVISAHEFLTSSCTEAEHLHRNPIHSHSLQPPVPDLETFSLGGRIQITYEIVGTHQASASVLDCQLLVRISQAWSLRVCVSWQHMQ